MYQKTVPWIGPKTTTNDTINRIGDVKVTDAEILKVQTADALEEAARKLRIPDVSAKGEDVKQFLQDVEDRVNQFKADVGVRYHTMEADYHKRVEPVEHIIIDHPVPSVLIAVGTGALIGCSSKKHATNDGWRNTTAITEEQTIKSEFRGLL
jgi:ElaB/YqjD/DUF883 family membrane-anchored ribosome-binding protein